MFSTGEGGREEDNVRFPFYYHPSNTSVSVYRKIVLIRHITLCFRFDALSDLIQYGPDMFWWLPPQNIFYISAERLVCFFLPRNISHDVSDHKWHRKHIRGFLFWAWVAINGRTKMAIAPPGVVAQFGIYPAKSLG